MAFMRRLLSDLRALEMMLDRGMIESGVRRIGAEQEMVLVDADWQPAPEAIHVLESIDDPRLTTEIARFNLECNLDPIPMRDGCLRTLRDGLTRLLGAIAERALALGARPLLTGILPTLSLSDLTRENITPRERYRALDRAITAMRGGRYRLHIKGIDDLTLEHDSVMLEALNTSFQLHYQVGPDEFPASYNIAQAVAGPMLAACANSPILFGKRLWRETRIAIFQQAVDTRSDTPHERDTLARVRFGEGWVRDSVLEIFRNDIARFRLLMLADGDEEDAVAMVNAGRVPRLPALQTHNSTIYRWNRACYGITAGRPHLRIECRVLPAGPSIADEVANAALWFGLMAGGPAAWPDLAARLDFDDARANFTAAAREGLSSQLIWLNGKTLPAQTLIQEVLIPVAREGLGIVGVDGEDADHFLGIVEQRVDSGQTGAQWMLSSVAAMKGRGNRAQRLRCLAAATWSRQQTGDPAHTWSPADLDECGDRTRTRLRVGQYMTTDLFTVHEDDLLDLVASIMDWEHIRHVPVEDHDHRLIGLVSYRSLLKILAGRGLGGPGEPIPVRDIMRRDPVTIDPETPTLEAIRLMKANRLSCLPVVKDDRLVGLVTEHDLMGIAGELLERDLRRGMDPGQ